jgi:hypothetical protein
MTLLKQETFMTYRIEGLSPVQFRPMFGLSDAELAARRALRVRANGPGFPCRVSLEEAGEGEELLLVNYASHDVETPFRTIYAIYVRRAAAAAAVHCGRVPDYLGRRTLGLRGFDAAGMLGGAVLAMPGEADARIRELFGRPEIASIHAHNAAHGCFLARVERG